MHNFDRKDASPLIAALKFYLEPSDIELLIARLETTSRPGRYNEGLLLLLGCLMSTRVAVQATTS